MKSEDIINALPDKFKTGQIIVNEGDLSVYLYALLGFVVFFFAVYEILKFSFQKFNVKGYMEKEDPNH